MGICLAGAKMTGASWPKQVPFGDIIRRLHHGPASTSSDQRKIPEAEFSGEIVKFGENAREELKARGVQGFGLTIPMEPERELLQFLPNLNSILTEYVVVHQKLVVPKSSNMYLEEESGLADMGATAIHFIDAANLKAHGQPDQ